MKKVLIVILCIATVFSSCAIAAQATEKYSDYPVILVPGYSSSYFYNGDTGEHVWGLDMDKVLDMVLSNIAGVGTSLGAMTAGNADKIAELVGNGALELCGVMACNPDGTSKYNIQQYYTAPEDSRYSDLMEKYPEGNMYTEHEICAEIAEFVGYENIYQFTCDFRMGQEYCAKQLDKFVEGLCKLTGKKKVNIFAVSHGGQTTSTYIALYGWKNRINNAVLTVPAIGGAAFAYDPMMIDIDLDEECIARFVEYGNSVEMDIDWLLKANELGFLDEVCEKLIPYLEQIYQYWGSMWDFIPVSVYEEVKDTRLDKKASARLISISDRYHYEIQPTVAEKMRQCRANGANINIIAGCGNHVVTGFKEDSDGIISTACSTGATVAPRDERFPAGYRQKNSCGGKYKISPDMRIDASTAYLPDNTWFVNGLFHGQTNSDPFVRDLMFTLLLTDKIKDVYSDKAYPQFRDTSAAALGVYSEFTGAEPGFITADSDKLVITNICNDAIVTITAVEVDGADILIKLPFVRTLKPGQSLEATIKGSLPEISRKTADVTICFLMDNITPQAYRTQTFTIMNGKSPEPAEKNEAAGVTLLGKAIGEQASEFLKKMGLYEYFSMIYVFLKYSFEAICRI